MTTKKQGYRRSRRTLTVYLQYRFRLSFDRYSQLAQNQAGLCGGCSSQLNPDKAGVHVDHDHVTGRVRGLLCGNCNLALGCVKDSVEVLERLASYLERV